MSPTGATDCTVTTGAIAGAEAGTACELTAASTTAVTRLLLLVSTVASTIGRAAACTAGAADC